MYKVRAITQAQIRAFKFGEEEVVGVLESHPLNKLALAPNKFQDWVSFQGTLEVYLNVSGNAYIFLDRTNQSLGVPSSMFTLRPDRVYIIPDSKVGVKGYLYRPEGVSEENGVPILPEDIIHVKLPNPGDELEGLGYGLSPIASMSQSADVDNQITFFLK